MLDFKNFACFDSEGNWYKGNLHSHTTRSDGEAQPQELVDWYWRHGYDFLAITDHDTVTDVEALKRDGIVLIPGVEFGYAPKEMPGYVLDMLGLNVQRLPEMLDPEGKNQAVYDEKMSPQAIIDDVRAQGGVAVMCHPYFMWNTIEPYEKYHGYIGLEAYNFVCDAEWGRGYHEIYWDVLMHRGMKLLGFATDDSHAADFGHGWIMVKAVEKTREAIMEAIKNGQFYATQGPQILHVKYSQEEVEVTFDRPCTVYFKADSNLNSHVVHVWDTESRVTNGVRQYSAKCRLVEEAYHAFRIEMVDETGKKAYTNPAYVI